MRLGEADIFVHMKHIYAIPVDIWKSNQGRHHIFLRIARGHNNSSGAPVRDGLPQKLAPSNAAARLAPSFDG